MTLKTERYDCNGSVIGAIDKQTGYARFSFRHDCDHPAPVANVALHPDVLRYIQEAALARTKKPTTLDIKNKFPDVRTTKHQIAYWYHQSHKQLYVRDNHNQLNSARILLEEFVTSGYLVVKFRSFTTCHLYLLDSSNTFVPFQVQYTNNEQTMAMGFTTPFLPRLVNNRHVEEYFIDATYNTNQEGYELYAVLAGVRGSGFPIAYLLLKTVKGVQYLKSSAIKAFLLALKERGLNPTYFFTDKDMAQIRAINETFPNPSSIVRLCKWHRAEAVKGRTEYCVVPTIENGC
jgi:hypothetical protein